MAPERSALNRAVALSPALAPTPARPQGHSQRDHQAEVGSWPLPARVVRQIQRQVLRAGRSLQRVEVRGAVIDNFDALGPPSPPPHSNSYSSHAYGSDRLSLVMSGDVEGEGERGCDGGGAGEDNDLTSLSWLQDRNLLRSINLAKGEHGNNNNISVQISPQSCPSGLSPTSDYLEESFTSEPADSSGSDQAPPSPPPAPPSHSKAPRPPPEAAYDPLLHTHSKPPYSFSCLIFMAIDDSPAKALPVKEIYCWIEAHFPYFRQAPAGWKNSVRHNLSLNKCFQKVEKAPSLGKGSLWMVDDQYRSNLLQAFSRSPAHPCMPGAAPAAPSAAAVTAAAAAAHPPPATAAAASAVTDKGKPDPELFPYLSRCLGGSAPRGQQHTTSGPDSWESLDEVMAAAMVLALKHGPGVLPPPPIISSCASQDHTYSTPARYPRPASPEPGYGSDEEQRRTAEALLHLAGCAPLPGGPPRLLRRHKRPRTS